MARTRSPTPAPRPILYPVIMPVPEDDQHLVARERVVNLSRHARKALELSAKKSGIIIGDLVKDQNGAPLPFNGWHWSVTHKPKYVGGVVAAKQIGMDIEKIRSCSPALFKKIAKDYEWHLANEDAHKLFFRYWTAKESVLKASGKGIRDLSKCSVDRIMDAHHLVIDYQDKAWVIEHFFFNGHIASVVKDGMEVEWTLLSGDP